MSADNNTEKAQFGSISIGGNVGGNVDVKQAGGDIVGGDQDRRTITAGRKYLDRIDGRAQVTDLRKRTSRRNHQY